MKMNKHFVLRGVVLASLPFCILFLENCKNMSKPALSINTSYIDKSVKPGVDFYQYANGPAYGLEWRPMLTLPLPAKRHLSFDQIWTGGKQLFAAVMRFVPVAANIVKIVDTILHWLGMK